MNKSLRVKIIMLTSTISSRIIEALQIGARGIVLKDAVAASLWVRDTQSCPPSLWAPHPPTRAPPATRAKLRPTRIGPWRIP